MDNLTLCREAGIFFRANEAPDIVTENPENLKAAIAYYQAYLSRSKVKNPTGFLRSCLLYRWWESWDLGGRNCG